MGLLEDRGVQTSPKEPEASNTRGIRRIPQAMVEKVAERFRMRFQQCIDNQGHYLLLLHIMVKLRKKYYPIIEQVIKINML